MIRATVRETDQEGQWSYWGWRVVLAMFLVTTILLGSAVYGFIILVQPLAALRGWSQSTTGNLVSAMWMMAPLALVCAPIIRRMGPWRLLVAGLLFVALSLATLPFARDFWDVYVLRLTMGAGKVFVLVSMPVIVSQWFSRRFGFAIAAAWCGGAFGGFVFAPATETLVRILGWKAAALALAASVFTMAMAAAILGGRAMQKLTAHTQTGFKPDSEVEGARRHTAKLRDISLLTAAPMAMAVMMTGIGGLAFVIQIPALLEEYGFSATAAAALLGLAAAGGMAGNLLAGWTLDRARSGWTIAGTAILIATGLLAFDRLEAFPHVTLAVAAALLAGLGLGACEILWITLTKRQFGTELFAITYGGWSFSYQAGYAMAGAVGGAIFAATSRTGFLVAIALLYLPAIVLSLWRPAMRNEEDAAADLDGHPAETPWDDAAVGRP